MTKSLTPEHKPHVPAEYTIAHTYREVTAATESQWSEPVSKPSYSSKPAMIEKCEKAVVVFFGLVFVLWIQALVPAFILSFFHVDGSALFMPQI